MGVEEKRREMAKQNALALVVFAAVACVVSAQFGFYDLEQDEDTKFHGTTGDILPQCFSTPNGLCADGGRTVLTPDATHPNLLGWYSFDDAYGLDKSGHANHAKSPAPNVGPGHDGRGQSAHFSGTDSFVIDHNDKFDNLRQRCCCSLIAARCTHACPQQILRRTAWTQSLP